MRGITYIYELSEWPDFQYNHGKVSGLLERVNFLQGQLHGRMEGFSPELRKQAIIQAMTHETVASHAIEDTQFDYTEIESAIARSMKIRMQGMVASSGMAKGAAEAIVAGITNFDKKISADMICQWQSKLYPGITPVGRNDWRNTGLEIKDIKSKQTRFAAPAPEFLPQEMKKWISWMNQDQSQGSVIKSAISQLWLLTLHPFPDGNGPISRIISLMLIAQSEKGLPRYYAPSAHILKEKDAYFQILESTQKGNLDVTSWVEWYLGILEKSILELKLTQAVVLNKQKLEDKMAAVGLSARQKSVLRKMSALEKPYFTSQEWAREAGYSTDTALREIRMLLNLRLLQKLPRGGRSTCYKIVL
jgi:Fic family protein